MMLRFRRACALVQALSCLAALLALLPLGPAFAAGERAPFVQEVTIAAPDVVAVEVRDPEIIRGRIVELPSPRTEDLGAWIETDGGWGRLIGPKKNFARIADTPPAAFLDRASVSNAKGYGKIGDSAVTAVYRKSVPYDSGMYRGQGGESIAASSFKHYIYLKLDKPLRPGSYTIRWPSGSLGDTAFDYSDTGTRAIAVHANQNGYAPGDRAKTAYLSLWLPGGPAQGAVNFGDYGLKTFEIVDEKGAAAFSGDLKLRRGPQDPEPGNGMPGELLEYPSASARHMAVEAVVPANPVRIRIPGHGYRKGQRVWLSGFTGPLERLNGFATVASPDANSVALEGKDGADLPFLTASTGTAVEAYMANRAGTYVYEIEFGAFQPAKPGKYRIRITGLGVSDPFDVSDEVWLRAAKTAAAGLYHQRSGIPLDGRFGYKRPEAFRPGPDFSQVESELPYPWGGSSYIGFQDAAKGAWLTSRKASDDAWGGYMDAGDFDRRYDHIDVPYLLLETFELSGGGAGSVRLGIPKSSEFLDKALYGDADALPDILHEAIWTMDMFRRLQGPDGSVRGGLETEGGPLWGEPSYLNHFPAFVHAPDHVSTYRYAGGAAKLAAVLKPLNPALAKVYEESAIRAWNAAEKAYADPDAYYAEAIRVTNEKGGFPGGDWQAFRDKLQSSATGERIGASGALFRLTGQDAYRTTFEDAWRKGFEFTGHAADGAWEYFRSDNPAASTEIRDAIKAAMLKEAGFVYKASALQAYDNLKHFYAPLGWGQGLAPDYNSTMLLMRSHNLTRNPEILKAMEKGSAQILGANQVGLSFTTGLGVRGIRHPLHEDHAAMGVPAPIGITIYGWAPQSQTNHFWIFGDYWSALPTYGTRENAANRRVEPDRFALPLFEYLIEHPSLVMMNEYTVQQSIATTTALWLYLYLEGRKA